MGVEWLSGSGVFSVESHRRERPGRRLWGPTLGGRLQAETPRCPESVKGNDDVRRLESGNCLWKKSCFLYNRGCSSTHYCFICRKKGVFTTERVFMSSEGTPPVSMDGVESEGSLWESIAGGLAPSGERTVTLGRRLGVFLTAWRAAKK